VKRWEYFVWPLAAAAAVVAVWQLGVRWSGTHIFPSPMDVERGLMQLAHRGLLWRYTADSLCRVGVGYVLGVVCGIPLGMVLGWYPLAGATVNPVVQMLRPISPLAWIPLAVVWFGIGNFAAVFLIFVATLFPVVVSTASGVRNIDGVFMRAGSNFGLSPLALLGRVVFPAALPQIIIGLRIALGIAWLVVVAAEMIAVDSGLGYLIIDSRNAGKRYDLVVAGMLLIGAIGLCLDAGIRRLENLKSIRWGFRHE
jgi:NitT/TauT family transport system permease protein